MAGKLTRDAYEKLIAEDVAWLEAATAHDPHSLERRHVLDVLRDSVRAYYPDDAEDARRERDDLRRERDTLLMDRDVLLDGARHGVGCAMREGTYPCDCGLSAIERAARGET